MNIANLIFIFMIASYSINFGCNWQLTAKGLSNNSCQTPLESMFGIGPGSIFQGSLAGINTISLAAGVGTLLTTTLAVINPYFLLAPIAILLLGIIPAPQIILQFFPIPTPFNLFIYVSITMFFVYTLVEFVVGRKTT